MSNTGSMSLSELRSLVRSTPWRAVDRTEKLIRSIQQSLQVEGYDVDEGLVAEALRAQRDSKREAGSCCRCRGHVSWYS